MHRPARALWLTFLLACLLPAIAAEPGKPTPGAGAAKPDEELEGVTATVIFVNPNRMLVVRSGSATDPNAPKAFEFTGGSHVPVSGAGKTDWTELKQGDPVLVSYVAGDKQARKVTVLARSIPVDPLILAQAGLPLEKPASRTFIGYVKKKEGDVLHVLRPRAAPPANRPSQLKRFVRHPGTKVTVLRDSWADLKKGDRVKIEFEKGNPRPANLVQVIWRGGEKPLPPGVATRLYDPSYDKSVTDVDGIGETGPVPANVRKLRPERKIKLRLPRT